MRNILKILVCVVALVVFTNCGCDEFKTDVVTVCNESNDTIMAVISFNYPDTCVSNSDIKSIGGRLLPNQTKTMTSYDYTLDELLPKNHIMQIFVFKDKYYSIFASKGSKYLQTRGLMLKRYELSREELEKAGWRVLYPERVQ